MSTAVIIWGRSSSALPLQTILPQSWGPPLLAPAGWGQMLQWLHTFWMVRDSPPEEGRAAQLWHGGPGLAVPCGSLSIPSFQGNRGREESQEPQNYFMYLKSLLFLITLLFSHVSKYTGWWCPACQRKRSVAKKEENIHLKAESKEDKKCANNTIVGKISGFLSQSYWQSLFYSWNTVHYPMAADIAYLQNARGCQLFSNLGYVQQYVMAPKIIWKLPVISKAFQMLLKLAVTANNNLSGYLFFRHDQVYEMKYKLSVFKALS